MELLLFSLAGCMAIDIVHILGRMRGDLRTVTARVERALRLSKEKYCSVYHSLRTDISIVITHALI